MRRGRFGLAVCTVLATALPSFAVQMFMDLGAGTDAPSISKDGTLIGGADGGVGFVAVYGAKTATPGATVRDVEYINGVPTAVGQTTSAAIWQPSTGWQLLAKPFGSNWTATSIGASSNNWWVAGQAGVGLVRYTADTDTPEMFSGPFSSSSPKALALSDTGMVAGAATYTSGGSSRNAFRGFPSDWLPSDAGVGSSVESEAFDLSSDGTTAVGWGYARSGAWQAHYWVGTTPHLIPIYGSTDWTEGHAVDGDGSVFGGFSYLNGYSTRTAWIWDTSWAAPKSVAQYLSEQGVNTSGWAFTNVTGISADGLSFVGTGTFNGADRSWAYAAVPEPGALSLLGLGGCLLVRRRSGR